MLFARKILHQLKAWKAAKRLKAHNAQLSSHLTLFAPIVAGNDLDAYLAILRGSKHYAPLVSETVALDDKVAQHNDRVLALESRFETLLSDQSIECILDHTAEYDQTCLGKIQETLQAIEAYRIPNEWRHKSAFSDYSVRFRALQSDWQAVREQHELVRQFRAIVHSLEDDFADGGDTGSEGTDKTEGTGSTTGTDTGTRTSGGDDGAHTH